MLAHVCSKVSISEVLPQNSSTTSSTPGAEAVHTVHLSQEEKKYPELNDSREIIKSFFIAPDC